MKMLCDSEFAKMLLEKRQANISSFFVYKCNYIPIVLCLCISLPIFVFFLVSKHFVAAAWVFGTSHGYFVRAFYSFKNTKKEWPLIKKVIDWRKVEELADTNTDTE